MKKLIKIIAIVLWVPTPVSAAAYPFSLIEISNEAKGDVPAKGVFRIPNHGPQTLDMRVENLGYYPSEIRAGGLEAVVSHHCRDSVLPPHLNLGDLGYSRLRRRYTCTYEHKDYSCEDYFGLPKPNRGSWVHTFDQNRQITTAELILRVVDGGREENIRYRNDADKIRISIRDTPGAIVGPEFKGGHRYGGGNAVSLTAYRTQEFMNPVTGATYSINVSTATSAIPTHVERDIVYVKPFSLPGQRRALNDAGYLGTYESLGETLTPDERQANTSINEGAIIYVTHEVEPGGGRKQVVYNTKVTHEKWRKDAWEFGFSIVSKKDGEKLYFSRHATIPFLGLEEGTYQLQTVKEITKPDRTKKHVEKWRKIDAEEERYVDIETPPHVTSIPGLRAKSFVVERVGTDIDEMRARLAGTQAIVDEGIERYREREHLFIIGKSAVGKTILLHALAGRELEAYREVVGDRVGVVKVRPIDPLPRSQIGEGKSVAGTKFPTPYSLGADRPVVWDCPGFEDPGGPLFDIVNSINIQRIITAVRGKRVRLGLVISEAQMADNGQPFLNYLKRITEMVPDIATLKRSLHVIVTKSLEGEHVHSRIADFNEPQRERTEGRYLLSDNAAMLLDYLDQEAKGREQILSLPKAMTVGRFSLMPVRELWERIERVPGYIDPNVRPIMGDADTAVKYRTESLINALNTSITRFLETEWYLRVIESCQNMVRNHAGTIGELRDALRGKKGQLESLKDGAVAHAATIHGIENLNNELKDSVAGRWNTTESDILDRLNALANIDPLKKDLDALKFLKQFKTDLVYETKFWKDALQKSIASIDGFLNIEDSLSPDGHTLTLRGFIVGTSDIANALAGGRNPKTINLYAVNTLFIDSDLTKRGVWVNPFGPFWKVTPGVKRIDLSGEVGEEGKSGGDAPNGNGEAGVDGRPGLPGGNAGPFFGKLFTHDNLGDLRIFANGGQGGKGGDGGRGGDGRHSGDGAVESMIVTKDSGDVCIIPWGEYPHDPKPTPYFPHRLYFNISDRQTHVGYLSEWIGPKFRDQIWVHGHVKEYAHVPQGQPGGRGGHGGKKGLGGNAGEILLLGADLAATQKEQNPGSESADVGEGGNGGIGGTNGKPIIGTKWTDCHIVGEDSRNPTDRWHDGPRHVPPALPKAADGDKPASTSPAAPAAPDPITQLTEALQNSKVAAYRAYYQAKAEDAATSYLIRNFPGLF